MHAVAACRMFGAGARLEWRGMFNANRLDPHSIRAADIGPMFVIDRVIRRGVHCIEELGAATPSRFTSRANNWEQRAEVVDDRVRVHCGANCLGCRFEIPLSE